jgi:PAS domain S-box-containing protein
MLGWKSKSWFYPKPTDDPGRDRNARTVQFACFLLAFTVSVVAILNLISGEPSAETPILVCAVAALVAAMVTNRAGSWEWAVRTAFWAVLLTAMLLVFEARDGFRSFAMLVFPGMLLISVMLLDRASYMTAAGMVLVAVAALGIAEKQGLTRAIPHVRSSTTYESIFFVDLNLLVFAMIGSRIANDAQSNVFDLRATIDRISKANLTLEETAEALRASEQQLVSIYNTVRDVIFRLAVEPEGRFRFVSVNAAFLRVTGLSLKMVVGKTVNEVIPEPSLTMVLGKYRQAVEEKTVVLWEETSDYPTGRLTGEVSVAPVFDNKGRCTHLVGSVHDITERKRAENLLRESEQRFRDLADSAPVMIWVIGPDKRATFFNKYCLDFTGHTMEEKLGDGWITGLHPEDRERFMGVYSSSIDARWEFNSIFRLRRADGKYRWVLFTGVPRFAAGVFSGYIGSCVDVADQKIVEEQLRANEARLKDAQRLAKVGSWERHIADDSIYWSDEMLQILGLPNAPPVDFQSFLNYVHPRDREKIIEADRKIRSGIASLEVEYRITKPSGSVRFVRSIVEAIRNDQGAVVRIAGAIQDVTEQVMARELLRESEKHLKNAERLAHLGHWQWDMRANRISGSEEMFLIFGKPQNYVPSYEQFLQDLVPQDRERVERLIRGSIEKKIGYSTEYQIALPSGELRAISCICEVLLDEEGLPARMFGTCQDVTDQRQAEVSLRRSLDQIAHLNRVAAMGELTAALAHELNQPLAAILSNAQAAGRFLGGESPDLVQVGECLTDIVADDKRAAEVINRLRSLLKKGEYQPSLVDLNEVVSEAMRLVGNDALLRQVSVKFEPLPGLPPVLGDRIQLYQVALNLIMNGLDAVAERSPRDRWVLVRTTEVDGGGVELTVEDSGNGVAASDLARVFEPFFTTKRDGLGMGLSISRSIVQAHGGKIWAENRAGRGAMFHCMLPVAQHDAAASAK